MAARIEENKIPLKMWTRRIKIGAALLFLISTLFMNGFFSASSGGAIFERDTVQELMGWNNIMLTLRESWFVFVALIGYLILKSINDYLDRHEQRLVEEREKEE
jgi:hypothetical protein